MSALADLLGAICRTWAPPPKWTVSQWSDARRVLSPEASAEKGRWRTSRAEYQREILDSVNDPTVDETVAMTSAQIGKTELLLNAIGYFIDYDPCPIMLVQPSLELGEAFSTDRLAPMIRDTPSIRNKVKESKSREAGNTKFQKTFPGGHITISGANSPTSLRSRPIRVVLMDEVSAYKVTAEGDPVKLAEKRTNNFWNRRIVKVSTPGLKGFCRIEKDFNRSDQRRFFVPCPHCETPHVFRWGNVVWPEGHPEEARLKCPTCEGLITNAQKNIAVARCAPLPDGSKPIGKDGQPLGWRATAPFTGVAGFHVWEIYSPWRTIAEIVKDFLAAKDDPSLLHVWVNTCLGETWEEGGDAVSDHDLISRCEPWPNDADVPERGLVLTAGVDVQTDRLEVETVAWAGGEESWSVDYRVIHGDPDIPEGAQGSPWTDLTNYIRKGWRHESGGQCVIEATCVDSGGTGTNTQAVYAYVKRHRGDRVFAIKGRGGPGLPIVGNPQRKRAGNKTKRPVDLYIIGTDQAKSVIYKRLRITAPGPGYCHFPAGRSTEYFAQLTAEKGITKWVKGFPVLEWHKPPGARNEALDCRVYAFAALILRAPQFDKVAFRMKQRAAMQTRKPVEATEDEAEVPAAVDPAAPVEPEDARHPVRRRRSRSRGGFVQGWR